MQVSLFRRNSPQVFIGNENTFTTLSERFIESVTRAVKEATEKNRTTRVFILDIEKLVSCGDDSAELRSMLLFVLRLKQIIRDSKTSLSITANFQSLSKSFTRSLANISDTFVSVDSFAGRLQSLPYEFKEFDGFFHIRKISSVGSLAAPHPSSNRFGIKRNRRKLCIEPLHLPPEESRAFGSAGTDEHLAAKSAAKSSAEPLPRVELKYDEPKTSQPSAAVERKKTLSEALATARATRQAMRESGTRQCSDKIEF